MDIQNIGIELHMPFQHYLKRQSKQHQYKLNSKIAHKAMRRYSRSEQQCKEQSAIKGTILPERQLLTPKTPINPIILQHEVESGSGGQQDGKFTMEHLCKVFVERFGSKSDCEFEAKELIELTGVKQRRIYDLMNILQGCGFMKRISKGTYIWYGFEELDVRKQQREGRKKEATSLSNLAARVKSLLYNSQNYIDFKDICEQILEENHHKFNPDSIKRRVYECWIIDKQEHNFKWISKEDRQVQNNVEMTKKTKQDCNQVETRGKEKDTVRIERMGEDSLIGELLRDVGSEQQLQALLNKVREKFMEKNQRQLNIRINPRKLFADN